MIERTHSTPTEQRRALYSPCGAYRYLLSIRIQFRHLASRPLLPVIGLNPSEATELEDDPTIRRVRRFALDLGFAGVCMLNVAARRSPDPRRMLAADDPIGPGNTPAFLAAAARLPLVPPMMVLGAWGTKGSHSALAAQVAAIRERFGATLHAFGLTANGQPLHPLYLPASARPTPLADLEADADAALRAAAATTLRSARAGTET